MERNSAFIKYLASVLLFGANGIVASRISLGSYEIVFFRTLIGGALLLGIFLLGGRRLTAFRKGSGLGYLLLSGVSMGGSWMLLYEAYARVGVGLATLLNYCGPVLVMALSPLLFREKLTAAKLLGFALVLAGVLLANGNSAGRLDRLGILCGALSAVLYAAMIVSNKRSRITGMENAALQLVISFFTVGIFILCKNGGHMAVQRGDIPWLLLLGVVNTGLGCYLYFSSMGALPVQTVAVCGYIEPLSAVVLAMLLLREPMTPLQLLGGALIIGGALVAECLHSRRQPA